MPAAVLEAALDSVKPAADAKGIRITSALDSEAGPLSGDSNRLQQVIWNLLTNAIKFTPRGGRIEVRLSRAGSHLEITVSDTGQGIAPRFLPHVFDRFRQEDASSTRRHGGLGLGLTIVRHIVELHGGTVTADSPGEGMGATFTVVLPVAALPKPQDVEREPARVEPGRDRVPLDQAPSLERVRVLIVDDEPSMRAVLREALEQRGAEVRDAGSSRQAMEQVQEWRPHLVVSDIAMPVEDGYEFIRRLREWERYEKTRIPAVALTAYTRPEDQARALEAGFQVHLAKPIDPMELVLVLSSLQKWSSNGAGVR
jgi:CheY-like chemotaxis protein